MVEYFGSSFHLDWFRYLPDIGVKWIYQLQEQNDSDKNRNEDEGKNSGKNENQDKDWDNSEITYQILE